MSDEMTNLFVLIMALVVGGLFAGVYIGYIVKVAAWTFGVLS